MTITSSYEPGRRVFVVELLDLELIRIELDDVDKALLKECGREGASVVDILLGLQTIAIRMEQQRRSA